MSYLWNPVILLCYESCLWFLCKYICHNILYVSILIDQSSILLTTSGITLFHSGEDVNIWSNILRVKPSCNRSGLHQANYNLLVKSPLLDKPFLKYIKFKYLYRRSCRSMDYPSTRKSSLWRTVPSLASC